jgi:hypothetical protein
MSAHLTIYYLVDRLLRGAAAARGRLEQRVQLAQGATAVIADQKRDRQAVWAVDDQNGRKRLARSVGAQLALA